MGACGPLSAAQGRRGVDAGRASEGLVAQEPGLCGNWFQIVCMEWTVTK